MKVGIGSYTYGWETGTYGREITSGMKYLTSHDLIDRAARFEVPVVQICVHPALHEMTNDHLLDIAGYAQRKGVELEAGTIGLDPSHLRRYLEVCRLVNASLLRVLISDPSPALLSEEVSLRQVLPEFEAAGVAIGVENHETYGARALSALMARVGSEYLGVCLDTVNSLGRGEGIREVTELLMPYTVNLHIKDYTTLRGGTDMGFTVTGAQQGMGKLETEWILSEAWHRNPDMSVILEQWTPFGGNVEDTVALQNSWAKAGIESLKKAIITVEAGA